MCVFFSFFCEPNERGGILASLISDQFRDPPPSMWQSQWIHQLQFGKSFFHFSRELWWTLIYRIILSPLTQMFMSSSLRFHSSVSKHPSNLLVVFFLQQHFLIQVFSHNLPSIKANNSAKLHEIILIPFPYITDKKHRIRIGDPSSCSKEHYANFKEKYGIKPNGKHIIIQLREESSYWRKWM